MSMVQDEEYSEGRINETLEDYLAIRETLERTDFAQIKEGSGNLKELLRLQDSLVRILADPERTGLPEHTGLMQKVREAVYPNAAERAENPELYSELGTARDTTKSRYLYGRQK